MQHLRVQIRFSSALSINVTRISIICIIPVSKLLVRVVSIGGGILRWTLRLSVISVEIHRTRRSLRMFVPIRPASDEPCDLVSLPKSDYDCGYCSNGGDDYTGNGSLRPTVVRV